MSVESKQRGGVETAEEAGAVSFAPLTQGDGVVVRDAIERRQCELLADRPVKPRPVPEERFQVPVDAAVAVTAGEVWFPRGSETYVRTPSGELVSELSHGTEKTLPSGAYLLELTGPIKLYLRVEGEIGVSTTAASVEVSLENPAEIVLGARSHHSRPAATVTTTENPRDMMRAVSAMGSALKTTSPERSFPTLRGHPPAIELGDELRIPDGLDAPDTGIRIEVPPVREAVYVVAPLAYYLGAEVVPGDQPRLVTDDGFEHRLGPEFEASVERVLKQTFFLDCVVRTEGRYPVQLHERDAVEADLGLDPAALYHRSSAERLAAYLSEPFDTVEEHLPTWKLTTHVAPEPENVETLPFLVDDLAVVRMPEGTTVSRAMSQANTVEQFARDEPVRSTSAAETAGPTLVKPEQTDSLEQGWVGDDAPVGANKLLPEAFRNRLRTGPGDGDIDIVVVCNDEEMLEEHDDVSAVYGSREELPFDVTVHRGLTTDRLRLVLESDIDFLHYIGHIEPGGFRCPDGILDAADIGSVGLTSFFLNACQSYEQGRALIRAGAVGGVATLDEIINSGAVRVWTAMARLLNSGFPLGAALDIASERSIVGPQYLVVGDGTAEVSQCDHGTPFLLDVESEEQGDGFRVEFKTYPTRSHKMGTMVRPAVEDSTGCFLASGSFQRRLETSKLNELLLMGDGPVRIDGQLTWTDCVDAE
jgi:hypothetical protein